MGAAGMDVSQSAQPFVGRRRQLHELVSAAALGAAGQGSLILVAGEPGIGKTRLAAELADWCRQQDFGVLRAACWDGDGAPAFWPWIQVIRALAAAGEAAELRAQLGPGAA